MKKSNFINTVKLDALKPKHHSFGLIFSDSIVKKVDWEQHNEYEILFMEKGYGTFLIGDNIFSCNEYADESLLLLFGKNLPHSFHYDGHPKHGSDTELKNVGIFSLIFKESCLGENFFDLPEMRKCRSFLLGADRGYIISGTTKGKIEKIIRQLSVSKGVKRLQLFLVVLELLTESRELEQISHKPVVQNEDKYKSDRINEIIGYLYSNYHRDIPVKNVAKKVSMSPQSFRLFFKRTTGQTFIKFLNQLRISKVCELLITTDLDITSVAFDCGFNNLSNFNRRFKQIKKLSPREFRAKGSR